MSAAWSENLILEKYYAPVLDTPSYVSKTGHRWPPPQRADAEQHVGRASPATFVSRADVAEGRHFIRVWSPVAFWLAVVAVLSAVVMGCFWLDPARQRSG